MKNIFLFLTIFTSLQVVAQNVPSSECELLHTAIKQLNIDNVAKHKVNILNQYVPWNVEVDFDFQVDSMDKLPTTPEERSRRLSSEIIDPYPMFYIFAHPITDSIFSSADRKLMRYIASTKLLKVSCSGPDIKLVNKSSQVENRVAFYRPLFSNNKEYAVIRLISNFEYWPIGKLFTGILQTLYFKKDAKRGWINIGKSRQWIL